MVLVVVTAAIAFLLYLYFLIVDKENSINIGISISTVLLSLISFGIPVDPKRTPGRILILTITLIFGAVNFWAYNAGLLSLLMADKFVFPIKSMRDLLEKEDYNLILSPSMCLKSEYRGLSTKAELLQLKLPPIICLMILINKKVGNQKTKST